MPEQTDDRPDKAFARLLRDHFLSFKEMIFESSKQQDSIAVWLVSMSTGAIAITISQIGKLNPALYATLKWSVGFLTGTIILGLLFRIFHLFLQDRDRFNVSYMVSWLAGRSEPSQEPPVNLLEDADAGFIAWLLYNPKVWTIHVMDGGLSPLLVIPQSTQKSFSLDLTAYRSKALHQNWRLPSYWLKPCRGTAWKPTKE